jgi:hypothetical protein
LYKKTPKYAIDLTKYANPVIFSFVAKRRRKGMAYQAGKPNGQKKRQQGGWAQNPNKRPSNGGTKK